MFNPPAALLAARALAGDSPRRRSPQARPVLDDPWADPLSAAPPLPPRPVRPRHRRVAWIAVALVVPARRRR